MIDSVVWAQHINVTDRQTDSHVAIAIAISRPKVVRVLWQKPNLTVNSWQTSMTPEIRPTFSMSVELCIQSRHHQLDKR